MDRLREFLDDLKKHAYAKGCFLGLLHVLIGRRIALSDGTVISAGITWRELAALLKRVRWDKDAVRDLGIDPATLPPRDRFKFWYSAIAQAGVSSEKATRAGDDLAELLAKKGYTISPAPRG